MFSKCSLGTNDTNVSSCTCHGATLGTKKTALDTTEKCEPIHDNCEPDLVEICVNHVAMKGEEWRTIVTGS